MITEKLNLILCLEETVSEKEYSMTKVLKMSTHMGETVSEKDREMGSSSLVLKTFPTVFLR
jgi:hypothetical protein